MIQIENLVKRYGNLVAVDHLDLEIKKGEIFGLLGPNGCGKTTTMNCMLALLKYDKGSIKIFGEEMQPDSYDIKKRIGVVMQNVAVFRQMTVYENIDYFCSLYVPDRKKRKQLVEEAIAFTGLDQFRKMRPGKLSGGLLRRLNIACGIAHKPELIHGKILAQGTCEELKSMIKTGEKITVEAVRLTETQLKELEALPHVLEVHYEDLKLSLHMSSARHNLIRVLTFLQNQDVDFGRVFSELPTLNDVFLEITGTELRDV